MVAAEIGKLFDGCEWVGIPFAGGMSEVPHIKARGLLVNDLHLDIINLAQVVAVESTKDWLKIAADAKAFHPQSLTSAQEFCKTMPKVNFADPERALNYFVAVWMGMSGMAGTDKEFNGNLAMRFTASGGGSNTRYRSAIEALDAWNATLRRCEFSTLDFRTFFAKCQDRPKHGLYVDAPWPDDGCGYKHKFTLDDQKDLARYLSQFEYMRVVVRFGDHPLIHDLYPDDEWDWRFLESRTQGNNAKREVWLTKIG